MSTSNILPKNIDVAKISLSEFKVKNKAVYVKYGSSDEPFYIQTPSLPVQFTMSKYNADKDKAPIVSTIPEKYGLQLSLKNVDTNKSTAHFFKMLKDIDGRLISEGHTNSKAWFRKQHDPEVVNELYTPLIHYSKDKVTGEIIDKYPPTFRFNVMVQNGKLMTDCVNSENEPIEVGLIEKGAKVSAILECKSIWFMNQNYGLMVRPVMLKVSAASSTSLSSYAFTDDPEDDGPVVKRKEVSEFIESSDDDDEDEAEPEVTADPLPPALTAPPTEILPESDSGSDDEEEEEVKPVPKKKVVVKKKVVA